MKVILLKDIANLGEKNDIKEVSVGYAKNFLIPQGLVEIATLTKQKSVLELKAKKEKEKEKEIKEKRETAEKIRETILEFELKGGKESSFGSIGKNDIVEKLKEKGIKIQGKQIELNKKIKTEGKHFVKINFGFGVEEDLRMILKII
jgi:large subunit ribosomal protein L9